MPEYEKETTEQQRLEKEQLEDLGTVWRTRGPHALHCLTVIGQIVMETLARIDTVAYVRFASVYKNFQAAGDFDKFVSELRPHTGESE